MKLKLNNIGIIDKADIKLDGLTVIAGENDSGKSTVGKVLYALIKTIRWSSNGTRTSKADCILALSTFTNKLSFR